MTVVKGRTLHICRGRITGGLGGLEDPYGKGGSEALPWNVLKQVENGEF